YDVLTETAELDVMGMTCAACSNRIEKVLNRVENVKNANVNLTTENATISYTPEATTVDELINKIHKLRYDATPKQDSSTKHTQKYDELKHKHTKIIITSILTTPLLLTMLVHLFGMQIPDLFMNPCFQFVLATPV